MRRVVIGLGVLVACAVPPGAERPEAGRSTSSPAAAPELATVVPPAPLAPTDPVAESAPASAASPTPPADAPAAAGEPSPPPTCHDLAATGRWEGHRAVESWIPGVYSRDAVPPGTVVLTFDDGPNAEKTPRLLDALASHGMHATFFIVGRQLKPTNYRLVRRMIDEGHTIGNHSYQHDIELASRGGRDSVAYIEAELRLTQAMLDLALLAESPEDFEQLVRRLHAGPPPYKPTPARLVAAWPAIAERHAAILRERGRGADDHPYPMVYARGPNGYPYLGKFTREDRQAYAQALLGLGLLNVMYHRNDMVGARKGMLTTAREGGVFVTHDWGKIADIERGLADIARDSSLRTATLDELTREKYGCSSAAASAALRAAHESPP